MNTKEQKAKEYAIARYGSNDERNETQYEIAKVVACRVGFEKGWDEALKSLLVDASKELPKYDESVWVINADGDQFYCHRSKEDIVKTDKCGWCNYTGSDIIAWIRPTSFLEILEMNNDVLMRLKDK